MSKRVNMDAVIAWLYVMETFDTCPIESRTNGTFVQLLVDLRNSYPDEFGIVLTVRDAHRLMGGMK
jgi:hypothetical protein